ncbi:BTB/POZ and TAZ domain-containing protein 1-like [Euphorbia lathyris]|uniref:BTB/POZ and TAZ domain-containing protein 1-like n=1 Tax=Euphorbia lathyris TaxID=212925 RepID=UPI003313630A
MCMLPSQSPIGEAYNTAKTNCSTDYQISDQTPRELPEPDVQIVTSDGLRIPAHTSILASVSSVLENIIDRPLKHRNSQRTIPILGVPSDAVSVFLRFIYSSRVGADELEKFGIHLLALSHVYLVPHLKQRCIKDMSQRLTVENVVDVLQLARLCDAPDLYLKCMKLISTHFKAVEITEAWIFMQNHDPWMELEILQFIDEAENRKKRTRRQREERNIYMELSVAMDCLEHICTEGCTSVGPYDVEPAKKRGPCSKYSTCQGVQLLIKHFAMCKNRVNGKCPRCKRMWQLLRLHSCICHHPDSCKVPLCRQFKLKSQLEKKNDDMLWKVLVRKVMSARVMSSLTLHKNRKEDVKKETVQDHGIGTFRLYNSV